MSFWDQLSSGAGNVTSNSQLTGGHGKTIFTDPNPVTGYLANKVGFDPSHPIQSIGQALGTQVPLEPGTVDLSKVAAGLGDQSQSFMDQVNSLNNRSNTTFAGQNALAQNLQNTIAGKGPSVALMQLGQGQDAIARQQLSQATGVGGANAANARIAAAANTANSQAQENQAQALLRAQEVAAAQNSLGGLYNSQLQGETGLAGVNAKGAEGFANTAESGAATNQQLREKENEANAKQNSDTAGFIGKGVASLFA